ncbi:hypothetical protein PR202_gb12379 [Eleusine coracana subsp. coracana]|uniref:Uncharacterized protein n=1 Tax=Eleusine coracana subsp. coracana TaxID=191504 RepID=A0AAV5EPV9_ELECO|nr:hypothetical protein PR202_gb12379 [Eleusine coracana subsp. coracana]
MEGGGELGGGEEMKVAIVKAAAEGALAAVARPNSDRADRIFKFAMRTLIVLGIFYFVLLAYVTATEPQLEKLYLVPFYIIAVTVPLYAAALMQQRGNSIVRQPLSLYHVIAWRGLRPASLLNLITIYFMRPAAWVLLLGSPDPWLNSFVHQTSHPWPTAWPYPPSSNARAKSPKLPEQLGSLFTELDIMWLFLFCELYQLSIQCLQGDYGCQSSGGAQLHLITSMNTDSLMRIPASPISFSSNNISGSSVIDGSIVQQSPPQEQVQKWSSSSVTSHPMIEAGGAFHAQKKSRIDVRQNDILQHQLMQQLLHSQSSIHLQGQQNPQLQALIQQHKLAQIQQRQQQQLLQPLSKIQQPQIGTPLQPQLRPPLAQPGMQPTGHLRNPAENGLCTRRLMQYLYHKRHRPENNPITYWKKLVEEYFAPRARERWCVSSYEKRGSSSVSPQAALDTWRCDICNTHGGKGYDHVLGVLFTTTTTTTTTTTKPFYPKQVGISEVVNHMKDLIEFTSKNNLGPIEGLNKFCKSSVQKLSVQNMHESKQLMAAAGLPNDQSTTKAMEVKQEMSAHVNRSAHVVGATDNNVAQNGASNYQNVIRSSGANQSVLQHEASNVFKGTAAMHNGIRLEASRSFRGPNQGQLAQFEHTMSLQHPMPQQNNFQGLGVHNNFQGLTASPQYQQHVLHQLLAAAKNTNNQPLVQQPPPDNPNVNSSLASVAANSNHAASREQAQRINEGTTKDACTMGTGPSNVINNSTVSMLPSRSNSFKSVSNNPASPSTGGNAAASKAESFHEMDDLDHLDDIINNQLVESGLFEGDQGGNGFLWNM